jgi:2-polyprenyl-3-methyl-5-hydroxy-6-metoxy-1,4-benzoquinol methylase
MQHIMMTRKRIIPNNRENWYADITSTILGNKSFDKNSIYLDIGCGDCNITRSIANKIGIDIQNVHGIDLLEYQHLNGICRERFDGKNIPENIHKADFITIFQVLHHIKSQKEALELLNSVYKHLNEGGFLLIREHEVNNLDDKKFWKFIHDFQCRVIKTASEDLDNGTLYIPSQKWETLLNKVLGLV